MKRVLTYSLFVDPSDTAACIRAMRGIKITAQDPPFAASSTFARKTVAIQLEFSREQWHIVEHVRDQYDRSSASREGTPYPPNEQCVFTKKEINTSELLELQVRRSPIIAPGVSHGMTFDWGIEPTIYHPAPWCWQRTPRLMTQATLPKPHVGLHWTIYREILVHRRIVDAIPAFNYEHIHLGPVVASGKASDWFQVMCRRVMPPFHSSTTGIQTYLMNYAPASSPRTLVGKQDEGYYPTYSRTDVLNRFGRIPPAAFSWELFGHWGIGVAYSPNPGDLTYQQAPPQPCFLVDQATRRALKAAGVTRLHFIPVHLVD